MEPNDFVVRDMLGQEIRVGATLLYPTKNELKLAEVDSLTLSFARSNPNKAIVGLRLTGRRNDPRYIVSSVNISNPAKYVVLDVTTSPASDPNTTPTSTLSVPKDASRLLVGSSIH